MMKDNKCDVICPNCEGEAKIGVLEPYVADCPWCAGWGQVTAKRAAEWHLAMAERILESSEHDPVLMKALREFQGSRFPRK